MKAWRMSTIFELEAEDKDAAEAAGRLIWERCSQVVKDIPGVRWMLPVGDFKEREPFATESNQERGAE